MPGITVAVLTNTAGAHLEAYLAGLSVTEEVEAVVVADPSGASEASAKKTLGAKLKSYERDHVKALAEHKPTLALVTMEADPRQQARGRNTFPKSSRDAEVDEGELDLLFRRGDEW